MTSHSGTQHESEEPKCGNEARTDGNELQRCSGSAIWKDWRAGTRPGPKTGMRPALQREHDLERPKHGNEACAAAAQRCSCSAALLGRTERTRQCGRGNTIWNSRRRGNRASAAAGTRFGTTRGAEMRPALQREHHFEGPKAIGVEKHIGNCTF